jgi:acetyl-CoA C-acetyltransferase
MGWNRVAIVGGGLTEFGELFDTDLEQLAAEAYLNALANVEKGLDPDDISAGYFANVMGTLQGNEIPSGATLANAIGLVGTPITRIENGCPTGSDAVRQGCLAVASGVHDVVVVVGAEKLRELPTKVSLLESGRPGHPTLMYARTAATLFSPAAIRHMYEFGTTREQMAGVVVKNRENGALNPMAQRQSTVTIDEVLDSTLVCTPFNILDCCPQTDGGAAVILCNAEIADRYTDNPIYVAGLGAATENLYIHEKQVQTGFMATQLAAKAAYDMAGIGPDDIDLAETHDCFSATEILNYEDLGFCEKGEGGKMIDNGETTRTGRIPVSPSGGLISKGHPIGATGVSQMVEIRKQLLGQAGAQQVEIRSGYGLQHNIGGYSSGISNVTILSNQMR